MPASGLDDPPHIDAERKGFIVGSTGGVAVIFRDVSMPEESEG
jgi:hypothetical protein